MPLTLPQYPPVAGLKAKASQVIAWLAAIVAKFNAGITSADASPNAGFTGTQISSASGTRITAPNLEDGAVINRVLKADATAGRANAAVKRDNIVDGEVVTAHLAALTVIAGKVKVTTHSQAFSIITTSAGTGDGSEQITVVTPAPALPAITTIIPLAPYIQKSAVGAPSGANSETASISVETDSGGAIFFIIKTSRVGLAGTFNGTLKFPYIPVS